MKKVNIITKHSAYNFGAMLQAYALQQTISELGAECNIIDLRQKKPQTKWAWKSLSGAIYNLSYKLHKKELQKGYEKFEDFINAYAKTIKYEDKWELYKNVPNGDVYITGSDQVWNPLNVSEEFFLRFAKKDSVKASYAASLGINYLPYATKNLIKEYISDFDYISVREQDGKTLLSPLTNKEINVNVDPTLLLTSEKINEIAVLPKTKKPYILCYVLYRPSWLNKWLKKVRKTTRKDIVLVTTDAFRNVYHNKVVRDAGPKEFLGLINGADFIISSSFHGVALSIASRKPFYAVVNKNMPSRISNLLSLTGLENRIVDEGKPFKFTDIDYSNANVILQKEKEKSLEYLKTVINNGKNQTEEKAIEIPKDISVVLDKCTACTVCKNVCPKNAISLEYDKEGFLYPKIDSDKCVSCGLCAKSCHVLNKHRNTKETSKVYYGYIKDQAVRKLSSSGGVFSAISDIVLKENGLIVGAYFDEKTKKILHASSDTVEFSKFRSSKYAESEMGDILLEIESALNKNRKVLFTGTPCECAGVRLKFKNNQNLLILDFLCHGVPSSKLFSDMLLELEKKNKSGLIDYKFRTKQFGWSQSGVSARFKNGKTFSSVSRCDWFYRACMMDNLFLRKSCYTCDKVAYSSADITIGDFWGVANYKPEINDQKGLSVIIVNTKSGEKLLEKIKETCNVYSADKKYIDYTLNVKTNDKKLALRDKRFNEYLNIGAKAYAKKYYGKKLFISKLTFSLKKRKLKKRG